MFYHTYNTYVRVCTPIFNIYIWENVNFFDTGMFGVYEKQKKRQPTTYEKRPSILVQKAG